MKQVLLCPSLSLWQPVLTPVFLAGFLTGINSFLIKKYLLEKLREWDPSLAQASLAMECWSWPAGNVKFWKND